MQNSRYISLEKVTYHPASSNTFDLIIEKYIGGTRTFRTAELFPPTTGFLRSFKAELSCGKGERICQ